MELESSLVEFLRFVINPKDLECMFCRVPPKPHLCGTHLFLCNAGHVVCHNCTYAHNHKAVCGNSLTTDCCRSLEDIASRIEIKCACGGYFQYWKLKPHQINCRECELGSSAQLKCRLRAMLLRCSVCSARLQPPIFRKRSGGRLICADCHHADRYKDQFVRCVDLEYLLKCLMVNVKIQRPFCIPCDEDETNSTLAASNNIVDAYESTRPPVGNATITGKTQGKAPSKVCKMDNHIVDSGVSESDDDSSDGIHPETGKRVAKTVLKTCAYNKKAKIATPSGGQKTVTSKSRGSRSTTLPQQPTIDAGLTPKPRPTRSNVSDLLVLGPEIGIPEI